MSLVAYVDRSGKSWNLPRLRARQVVALSKELRERRREALLRVIEGQGADVRMRRLEEFERFDALALEVARWAITAEGTMRIVEESIKLLGNGASIDDVDLDLSTEMKLALDLLGLSAVPAAWSEDQSADPTDRQENPGISPAMPASSPA